jgi:hypothetical protein
VNRVGRSRRTPAKHRLMDYLIGKESGAASKMAQIRRHVWIDLTAGDGLVEGDLATWYRNCSPGLFAYHAAKATKPVEVRLYEVKQSTYDRLLQNLGTRLPELGYTGTAPTWTYKNHVSLRAILASGGEADTEDIDEWTAVFASNDPNAITDWAMRPTFSAEIARSTKWFRSISTLGCNVTGLKRTGLTERLKWYEQVKQQEVALPRHRNLLLAAIERDDSQWAYLINEADKWRANTENDITKAFAQYDMSVRMFWYRGQNEPYSKLKDELFLTKAERQVL